ncbi:MAG TPA: TonB family protein [Bryobacteraceae bacterium]|nr:TonB family protein [Bryobacteraceae bacterium]HOQ43895.1 TonB family protein [Bryobacteraceae bacterium]HPQ15594.1 TonB family protein [Bryobacteraceae bacterium]HPU71662.1 TonB family protein [Bryobacteraceae bacterium]
MFEQSLLEGGKTNRPWTVMVSFILQILLIGVAILIPLLVYDQLPRTQLTSFLVAPPPPPPPPPPPAAVVQKVARVIPRQFDAGRLMAPKAIPKKVLEIKEEELPPPTGAVGVVGGVPGGVPGGTPGGVIGGIIGAVATAAPPPPPPPPVKQVEAPKPPQRIRVGGNVQQANLIRRVTPQYPPLAKQARIQGVVRFTAIISKDGTIQNLQLISGHPLLVPAAQEAVKQWVYRPTLLNGEPVEVVTQIDVNFTLSQ